LRVPICIVSSIDHVARQTAIGGVTLDVPGVVVIQHDLEPDRDSVRRVVTDISGVLEELELPLRHSCLSCTLREEVLPTMVRLAATGRWSAILLALPVGATPDVVVADLEETDDGEEGWDSSDTGAPLVLRAVVSLLALPTFEHDLFGDDLLAERGLHASEVDRRSVGEALAGQVESADVIITSGLCDVADELLDHLSGPVTTRVAGPYPDDWSEFFEPPEGRATERRLVAQLPSTSKQSKTTPAVWTLDLNSWRPFHPQRLHEQIERLGIGKFRTRGHFWLPTRPSTLCGWDAAGGQLSIGNHGTWGDTERTTRLLVTGLDPDDPDRITEAFERVLMTDLELAMGLSHWQELDDGFSPWIGSKEAS